MKPYAVIPKARRALAACWLACAGAIAAEPPDAALSPRDELATFHFADENVTAELVASEPDIVAPVAIAWDADGRLFVAEMTDYPSGPVSGRIRLLEDRDGDGRFEHSTIFADKIAFPNGVMPWNGGLLVTAAPDILFFQDTDGDGRADERRVVLTGFAEGNQQLRANGLYWGLDNWIYGANGRSDGDVRWVGGHQGGASAAVSIRRRDFRFRPDSGKFEAIAGHSQFGCAHDDWGNRFPVFNNIPIRHVVLEQRYLDRQPLLAGMENVVPISAPGDNGRVYYLAPPTLLIPQASDYFTSACGPTVYRGDAPGSGYRGDFFVCEPVHNLVQRRRLVPAGATFLAERTDSGQEFLASTDPWFHPVFTATGPDGALYVVDFYRKYVEHPRWVADELKETTPWRTGEEHGRIWRIRPKAWKPGKPAPPLTRARPDRLVACLEHENGWWRDTAQRLLVERQDRSVITALEKMARTSLSPRGRLHAIYTLDGLGALSPDLVQAVLTDPDAHVREHAVRLAEPILAGTAAGPYPSADHDRAPSPTAARQRSAAVPADRLDPLRQSFLALAGDADAAVRFQVALTLGELAGDSGLTTLARLAQTGSGDHWQTLAILSSAGPRPWLLWRMLARAGPHWMTAPDDDRAWFIDRLAALVAGGRDEGDLKDAAATLDEDRLSAFGRMVLLGNLLAAQKSNPVVGKLVAANGLAQSSGRILADAERAALSDEGSLQVRLAAIGLLGRRPSPATHSLTRLLLPGRPAAVQGAAVNALADADEAVAAGFAFDGWERYTRPTRRQLIAAATRSPALAAALLAAVERGRILLVEIDPATRQALQKSRNADLRRRAEGLFQGAISPDREQVVRRFKPALQLNGDRRHGAEIFARTCLQCHAMQGQGNRVGPDLSGIAVQPKETLLMNILDPSRQVLPDFLSYTIVPADGEPLTGLIAAESDASVTLRRPNVPDLTIQRSGIKELKTDGKSLMPEGLEQGLTTQDMADLLSFLRQPDAGLLPTER
jgi:putative membrane-bound dehydrogenase-like protein